METRFVTILLLLAFAVVAYLSEGVSSAPADEQTAASTEAKLSVVAKLRLRICLKGLVEKTKEAHDGTKRLMNAEAYDRLREARSHYEDEQQFVGTKPEPVDRGEGLRNMINNLVLNHAAKCFSDVGKDIKDKVAIQYLVQKFDLFGDLMEIYYGCEHGEKTKEFLLESGLFETILPESRLSKLKKDFDVREQCFKAVAAAHSAAHDELKRLVDDTVKSRLKEARELYADPKTSNNEPKPAPLEGCKAIQELASKALKAGDECMYKKDVVGWNRAAAWYHMTKRFDDRGLDLTELDTACEWGERSAAEFKAAGTLDIIANPKRHSAF